jgi:hypothetical protein
MIMPQCGAASARARALALAHSAGLIAKLMRSTAGDVPEPQSLQAPATPAARPGQDWRLATGTWLALAADSSLFPAPRPPS